MTTNSKPLSQQVYQLHLDFQRAMDNQLVLMKEVTLLIDKAKQQSISNKEVKRYLLPKGVGIAVFQRSHAEISRLFEKYLTRDFAETLLIAAVSQFESYLFEVLRCVLTKYPNKLTTNLSGKDTAKESFKMISLEVLLNASSKEEAINTVIDDRLFALGFAKPIDYLKYLTAIASIECNNDPFELFVEMKATRDVLVHNKGVANQIYMDKAGRFKRGSIGELLPINSDYFIKCVRHLKLCSDFIQDDIDKAFPIVRVKIKRAKKTPAK